MMPFSFTDSSTKRATHLAPGNQLEFQFFDLSAIIESDSPSYLDMFSQMYRRFRVKTFPPNGRLPVTYTVLTHADNPWGQPVMILNGNVHRLNNLRLLRAYIFDGVLNAMVAGIRSHFLIHAGVVEKQGQGVIIAADSGHGKTTLTLELVRRGFHFLSDELAAISRVDRHVYPFPRKLRILPDTLKLAGFPSAGDGAPVWLGKLLLDIDEIQPNSLGTPVSIRHIVILQNPDAPSGNLAPLAERELGVLVDRLDDALVAAVRRLEGVTAARTDVERGYPTLRYRATHRMAVLPQVEALCRQRNILLLDISKRPETRPNFHAPARLEPIPKSQAVVELLRRFQGGHQSALLQDEFGGSSTRLFMELASLVAAASSHNLFVGPLNQMADFVCDLISR